MCQHPLNQKLTDKEIVKWRKQRRARGGMIPSLP